MDIKQIDEKISDLVSFNKELTDSVSEREDQSFTEEELAQFDKNETEIESLKLKRATQERLHNYSDRKDVAKAIRRQAPAVSPKNDRRDFDNALRAQISKNKSFYNNSWGDSAERIGHNYRQDSISIRMKPQTNVVEFDQSLTDAEGGHTVNDGVVVAFEKALKHFWSWQNLLTVRRTSTGEPLKIPTLNDTANEAAYVDELAAVTNTAMTFSNVTLGAYKIGSGVFPISNEIIQDSQVNIASVIGAGIGERLAMKVAREITVGDGEAGHIDGFANNTTAGVTSVFVDGFDYEDLVNMYWSLDEAYKPNATWMMHSQTMAFMMTHLVDTTGRPLFMPFNDPLVAGPRYSLLGRPVVVNDYLDPVTPGTPQQGDKVLFFGDFSKVNVRIVRDVEIKTSVEKYWLEDAAATMGIMRLDSKYINAGTNPIKHLLIGSTSGAPSVLD